MDRAAQPEPSESGAPPEDSPDAGAETPPAESAPAPPDPTGPDTPATGPAKPRIPAAVIASEVLLWLLVASAAWTALVGAVATSFEVSAQYSGSLTFLEFTEPLLIAALASLIGLLAVKLWTGRDWARHTVVIVSVVAVAAALLTRTGLHLGLGALGTAVFAALIVLLLVRPSRNWCDPQAPGHCPRAERSARPPHLVVNEIVVLWALAGAGLYVATRAVLGIEAQDDPGSGGAGWAWAAILLVIVHMGLNIAFTFGRNWSRWATIVLLAGYAVALATLAVMTAGAGWWAVAAALCLIPLALGWALLRRESREWCRRETASN
jgi:hypothetical protein